MAASTNFLRADGTWTAPAGGGGGGITTEDAVDAVAGALTEGVGIDIAYDDGANTITVTGVANTTKADKTTTISTTAPLTGGGSLAANRTLAITDFTTSTAGAVPTPGGASSGRFLKDDGTWALPPSAVSGLGGVFPFTYNTSTLESITGSQLRGNNTTFPSSTKLWVFGDDRRRPQHQRRLGPRQARPSDLHPRLDRLGPLRPVQRDRRRPRQRHLLGDQRRRRHVGGNDPRRQGRPPILIPVRRRTALLDDDDRPRHDPRLQRRDDPVPAAAIKPGPPRQAPRPLPRRSPGSPRSPHPAR